MAQSSAQSTPKVKAGYTKEIDIKNLVEFLPRNPEHLAWAKRFISDLSDPILSQTARTRGFQSRYNVEVWLRGEMGAKNLLTYGGERVDQDQTKYLFPSDVVQLLVQLAKALKIPVGDAKEYFDRAKAENGEISEARLGWVGGAVYELFEREGLGGAILAKIEQLSREETQDENEAEIAESTAAVEPPRPEMATAKVVAGGGGAAAAAPEGGSGGGAETTSAELPPVLPTDATARAPQVDWERERVFASPRELDRARHYEAAWLFHHAAFDLLGEARFNPNDPRLSILQKTIDSYLLTGVDPTQLANSFANPSVRLRLLANVYSLLASDLTFVKVSNLTAIQISRQAEEITKDVGDPDKRVDPATEKKLATQMVLQELTNQFQIIDKNCIVDGTTLSNLGYSIDAIALGLGNQQLAAQLGLKTSQNKNVEDFFKNLTADQIIMIFFGGKASAQVEQAINANLEQVKKFLAGAVAARAVDISFVSQSSQVLTGIATSADIEALKEVKRTGSFSANSLIPNIRNAIKDIDQVEGVDGVEAVAGAFAKSHSLSHSQVRTQFESHAIKIWNGLSAPAQELAFELFLGGTPNDLGLQQKIRLPNGDEKYEFNVLLSGMDWVNYANTARKLDKFLVKLKEPGLDISGIQQLAIDLRSLNVSDALRSSWLKQYLFKLSKEQLAFLAKTEYVRQVETALNTADRLVNTYAPGSKEWREAVLLVQNSQKLVDADKLAASLHPLLAQEYSKKLAELSAKQNQLLVFVAEKQLLALPEESKLALSNLHAQILEAEKKLYLTQKNSPEWQEAARLLAETQKQLQQLKIDQPSIEFSLELAKLEAKYQHAFATAQATQDGELANQLALTNAPSLTKLQDIHAQILQAESLLFTAQQASDEWQQANELLKKVSIGLDEQVASLQVTNVDPKLSQYIWQQINILTKQAGEAQTKLSNIHHGHTLSFATQDAATTSAWLDQSDFDQATQANLAFAGMLSAQTNLNPEEWSAYLIQDYSDPMGVIAAVESYEQAAKVAQLQQQILASGQEAADTTAADDKSITPAPAGYDGSLPQPISAHDQAARAVNAARGIAETAKTAGLAVRAAGGDVTAIAQLGLKFASFWSNPENREKVRNIAGGIIAGGIAALYTILGRLIGIVGSTGGAVLGALAGGGLGLALGGPIGAVVGGIIGGGVGWLAGDKLASKYALEGIADLHPSQIARTSIGAPSTLPVTGGETGTLTGNMGQTRTERIGATPSINSQMGGVGELSSQPALSGGTTLGYTAPEMAPASAGAISGATGAASSLLTTGSLVFIGPTIALGAIFIFTIGTIFTIYSAFLVPLPIGDSTARNSSKSEYLELYKTASPKILPNDTSGIVNYKIVAKPLRGYSVVITNITDEISYLMDKNTTPPTLPAAAPTRTPVNNYLPPLPTEKKSLPIELEYKISYYGGHDVLVRNTAKITYDVYNRDGELVASNQTTPQPAATSVRIGNPKVLCWPTTGTITQLPYSSYSHKSSDAYDIAADSGTKIYAPFSGTANTAGSLSSGGYGLYISLTTTQGALKFAHLSRSYITTQNQEVSAGEVIGLMGSSGNSSGSHLHYEHAESGGSRILQSLVPESPKVWQKVYTCF